ncbi:hypothetical protein C922_05599 [Plasmodium inui San Antonio 1]|uniref:Serine aminopeptidase S33 domain-containing protein n=1 Tax=Plasmodium inui San Antonio 1 TaxID=1237626 RepID=W7A4K6_9APIC|nr:hypothetical protein C922_05599 [Plasmodium inui San Antonio 1]EUD64024.1 hypothetical protein C922_05599 [Plasmodium inui San Antonio 1]
MNISKSKKSFSAHYLGRNNENNYYLYKDSWIEHLNRHGYSVYGIDLQGHGQSDGYGNLKANVKEYDDMVYDVIQYIHEIHDKVSSYGDKSADSSSSRDETCEEVPSTSNTNRGTFLCVKGTEEESEPTGKTEGKLSDRSKNDKSSGNGGNDKSSRNSQNDKSSGRGEEDKSSESNSSDKSSISPESYKSSDRKGRDKWYSSAKKDESGSRKISDASDSKRRFASSSQIGDKSINKTNATKLLPISETGTDLLLEKGRKKKALPIYIIGQSMGGNVALRTLQLLGKSNDETYKRLNIKGCISLSTMISIEGLAAAPRSYKYSCFYLSFFKMISCLFPSYRFVNRKRYKRHRYMNDVIRFDKIRYKKGITCRLGYEVLKAMKILDRDIIYIPGDIPILFIHSKDDALCYYKGVVSFFNRLKNDNKQLYTLEKREHMLSVEPGNENILKKILTWLADFRSAISKAK